MKKVIFSLILIFLVGISYHFINQSQPTYPNAKELSNVILFYGDGCPHCANLEIYLVNNHIYDKFRFQKKEVFKNRTNAQELVDIASRSGLKTETVGVPFLWDGSKSYIGEEQIQSFFNNLIKGS